MSSMDIHSEQFEELLGEALRGGPGSPAWRQATEMLHAAGQEGEEYAMLCRAREDLASGREYRSVRAGPGFTQKLMSRLERENPKQWQLPTANIVTLIAVVVIALTAGGIAWMMFSPARGGSTTVDLQETFFVNPLVSADFGSANPKGLVKIGLLPVTCDGGMKVEVRSRQGNDLVGGGFYCEKPLDAGGAYAVESAILVERADTELIAQVFVSDQASFAADTGLTSHEIACLVEAGKLRVMLPDGRTVAETPLPGGEAAVRVRFDRESAVVEMGGKAVWSGKHLLAPAAGRYAGVRYLTRGGDRSSGVTVKSLRVMAP